MKTNEAKEYCYEHIGIHLISKEHNVTMYAASGYSSYAIADNDEASICYWFNNDLLNGDKVVLPKGDFAPLFNFIEYIEDWEIEDAKP